MYVIHVFGRALSHIMCCVVFNIYVHIHINTYTYKLVSSLVYKECF